MKQQIETILHSPEGSIDGLLTSKSPDGDAWEFMSIDGTIHIVIAKDEEGRWERIGGTEPYLSSWVEELSEHIA
jgi:hypothetical protein